MEIYELVPTVVSLGGLLLTVFIYVKVRSTMSSEWILEKAEDILDEIHTNKNLQTKIFNVGALIGNGISTGAGLNKVLKGNKSGGLMGLVQTGIELFRATQGSGQNEQSVPAREPFT